VLDYTYSGYSIRERLRMMVGLEDTPFLALCRAAWLGAAIYTASFPDASFYIAPHIWLVMVLAYYFYPQH
jgi:hypothetical protein